MYNSNLENNLLVHDVVSVLQDYCSIQPDTDETKIKAAAKVAQDIDIGRMIGKAALNRAIDPQTPADTELRNLMIPAWAYFTYGRLLSMFQGVLTDGGFTVEVDATNIDIAKSTTSHHFAIANAYMDLVYKFLEAETPPTVIDKSKATPSIRVFGGEEYRSR